MTIADFVLYGGLWLTFGAGHSLLASNRSKAIFDGISRGRYRLAYNVAATLHLVLVWGLGKYWLAEQSETFDRPEWLVISQHATIGVGAFVLLFSLRRYDLRRFAGIDTSRYHLSTTANSPEPLQTTNIHAFVLHPLYLGLFCVLWGAATDEFSFATAVFASMYILAGTWFEERRLVVLYGEAYLTYKKRVPAFLPSIRHIILRSVRGHQAGEER